MHIYYLNDTCPCEECKKMIGGVRKIYNHVDILNRNGYDASILLHDNTARCRWFNNNTPIEYLSNVKFNKKKDYLVIPEVQAYRIINEFRGIKKIIFNQNCYLTFFRGYNLNRNATYWLESEEIKAVLVVSEDSREYNEYIFPNKPIFKINNGVDFNLFEYTHEKEKQISFINKNLYSDAVQIINILNMRKTIDGFKVVEIKNKKNEDVAKIMKNSLIFLSLNHREGFGLTPIEAMACGCIVVGYPGGGGEEYFNTKFNYPIKDGDIIKFAKTIEEIIINYNKNSSFYEKSIKAGLNFVKNNYSLKREENDVLKIWKYIIENCE